MGDSTMDKVKMKYLHSKEELLREFTVPVTEDISKTLESLYPNEIAIEHYTRKLILKKLGE